MAFGVKTANMFELLGDEDEVAAPSKAVAKPQAESKKPTPGKQSPSPDDFPLHESSVTIHNDCFE